MVVGEQHGCLLERHSAPPTCCGTPAGGFFVLPHRTASASTDVGGRVIAGGSAVVRVGRVVGVAVSLGDSVTLGAGRVPERWSRYGSTKCCHQVLQPPSSRASPIGASPPDQRGSWDHVPAWGRPLFGGDHPKQVRTRFLTGHPSDRQAKPEPTPMWHGT
jgi:hypothetical protein